MVPIQSGLKSSLWSVANRISMSFRASSCSHLGWKLFPIAHRDHNFYVTIFQHLNRIQVLGELESINQKNQKRSFLTATLFICTGTGCTRRLWMPHPWRHSRAAWAAGWWPADSRGLELDDHCGPFQPRPFYGSVRQEGVVHGDRQEMSM